MTTIRKYRLLQPNLLRLAPLSLAITAAVGTGAFAPQAHAFRFEVGSGIEGNFDSTLSLGMQMRAEDRNCNYLGYDNGGCANFKTDADTSILNGDDGNLNYNKGQLISQVIRGTHDLYLKAPNGWKALVRGAWFYDFAVDNTQRTDIPSKARDIAVRDAEILDAYVQKDFEIADQPSKIRAGKQVVTWGEAILTFGGINAINPLDLRKANSAGVQLKELYRPTPILDFSTSLTDNFGIETYYQWGFDEHILPAKGTFFSPFDMATPGAKGLFFGTPALTGGALPAAGPPGTLGDDGTIDATTGGKISLEDRLSGNYPGAQDFLGGLGSAVGRSSDKYKKGGQFGLAARYTFEDSGDQLGLYYIRYQEKTPAIGFVVDSTANNPVGYSSYFVNYAKDRDLFGASYNFRLGDWSWGAELAYRPNDAVIIDQSVPQVAASKYSCLPANGTALSGGPIAGGKPDGTVCPGFIETERYQATLSGLSILRPESFGGLVGALGASEGQMIAELAVSHLPNLDLSAAAPGENGGNESFTTHVPYAANFDGSAPTRTTAGLALSSSVTYPNAFGTRASLSPELNINHGLYGNAAGFFPGFSKNVGSFTTALNVDFKTDPGLTGRIDFTHFYGGGSSNPMLDKDFLGFSLTTSF
jgi:hypothetical protein